MAKSISAAARRVPSGEERSFSARGLCLPDAVHARLQAEAGPIARRMSLRIASEIPLGEEFRSTGYLRLLLRACRQGVDALIRHLHDGRRPHPAELVALGTAGARQAEMGVPLDVLLAAYRLAAKMIWREVVDEATTVGGLDPATVVTLTDQVLEYLDDISAAVGSAYLARREEVVRRRDRERDHLLRRLLAGDAGVDLRRQAVAAGLELAPPYRALAVSAPGAEGLDSLFASAWRSVEPLVVAEERGLWLVLVDPAADWRRLIDDGRRGAATGPRVTLGLGPVAATLEEVAPAAARARRALEAGQRLDPTARAVDDRDVGILAAMADHPDEARAYVERHLGAVASQRRGELLETLQALVTRPSLGEAADMLGVHRHTVVYRLGRIRDLLGVDLEDPETRHRIWLALVMRTLLRDRPAEMPPPA